MTSTAPAPATPVREKKRSLYKGDPGMWSWVAHRISGVAIFFFLLVHVLDMSLMGASAKSYDEVIGTYRHPIVGLMEIGLVALLLFHSFNGMRIVLVDFWAKGVRYQRTLLWVVVGVWVVVFAASTFRLLFIMFEHAF